MSVLEPAGPARSRSLVRVDVALLLTLALVAGALVALSAGAALPLRVLAICLAGLGIPAALLVLLRPHYAVGLYLAVLPLLLPWPVAAGMNAGEVFTLAMLAWGTLSLWEARDRVEPALRALGPIVWPLGLLALISAISLAVNGITAFQEIAAALLKMMVFALAAILVHIHADTPKKTTQLLHAALIGAAGVAVYAVIEYLAGWGYSEEYGTNRAAGTFEHWNELGGFMALMCMPTLAAAVRSRSLTGRLGFGAAFVLEVAALLLSQTLGSVAALILGGVLAIVFLLRFEWRKLFAIGFTMAVGVAIAIVSSEALRDKVLNADERVMDRLRTYAVGIAMFRDRFWFGFGSEQAIVDELWFGEADYGITIFGLSSSVAHNSFIAIGVEKGFFGAVLFALLVVGALRLIARARSTLLDQRYAAWYTGLSVGMLAFLVQNMTNTLVLHARIGIVFFALIALLTRLREYGAQGAGDA